MRQRLLTAILFTALLSLAVAAHAERPRRAGDRQRRLSPHAAAGQSGQRRRRYRRGAFAAGVRGEPGDRSRQARAGRDLARVCQSQRRRRRRRSSSTPATACRSPARTTCCPIDAKLESERDLDFEAIRLDVILRQLETGREGKTSLVFLDACRDNPLARNLARAMGVRSVERGLAPVQSGAGFFIAFSTQPGAVARDGSGRNSPFAARTGAADRGAGQERQRLDDRRAQGCDGGDRRPAGAVGPLGADGGVLFQSLDRHRHRLGSRARRPAVLQEERMRRLDEELATASLASTCGPLFCHDRAGRTGAHASRRQDLRGGLSQLPLGHAGAVQHRARHLRAPRGAHIPTPPRFSTSRPMDRCARGPSARSPRRPPAAPMPWRIWASVVASSSASTCRSAPRA